jgi:hypothetical protein
MQVMIGHSLMLLILMHFREFSLEVRENKTYNLAVIKFELTLVIIWNDKDIISSHPYQMRIKIRIL